MTTSEPIAVRRRGTVAVIDMAGDVNAGAERALDEAWAEAVGEQPDAVVLNFKPAGFINSTGIALIVSVLARARAQGRTVLACGLSEHYRQVFSITRLADFLAINPDEDSAVLGVERSSA